MVDDVKDITENAESKVSSEALDRSRLARERREAEQRKRLDELRAHAAAAQAQREKRDEERRKRQAEQRARDDDRRHQAEQRARDNDRRLQVEERKRAIWEASVSRREALLQREKERTERLERARAARSTPRPAFAFGSSTPRLLEPVDSAGFFWAARRAASTTNVMFASAPLTRRASALQLDTSDTDNKDEPERRPAGWTSVARRRTDLVPTLPAPRAPGRAHSMTRLDRLPRPPPPAASLSAHLLGGTQTRSGDTTPGSRPGSALSGAGVVRRAASAPRRPRPASIAGTGVNTPRGGVDTGVNSVATTPSVSRDGTTVVSEAPRRPPTARRPRPLSMHASPRPAPPTTPGEGKPPLHRKPKPSKEHEKRGKSQSPGRALSPPRHSSDLMEKSVTSTDKRHVSAIEVTQKLEALQIGGPDETQQPHQILDDKVQENKQNVENKVEPKNEHMINDTGEEKSVEVQKPVENNEKHEEKKEPSPEMKQEKQERKEPSVERKEEKQEKKDPSLEKKEEKREERKEPSQEKTEENEMTASMTARRITTEEEAKAALAERRRRAREELERQAERERQRLQREAEEEAERQRQEEERQRREEEEARELAALQRRVEEEKLRKAIEAQQQLEREEAARRAREEEERRARAREEEDKRRAAGHAERLRREEAEREERERLARKQRVEAIMARTRLRKQAEEDKKQQDNKAQAAEPAAAVSGERAVGGDELVAASPPQPQSAPAADNGNGASHELLQLAPSQQEPLKPQPMDTPAENQSSAAQDGATNNGNVTADLLGLSERNDTEDKIDEQSTTAPCKQNDNAPTLAINNGNQHVGHISASFIQNERVSAERGQHGQQVGQTKLADVATLLDDDFTTHNGHSATHNHPLTLQNAI